MLLHLMPRHYFKPDRHFYICSFGGCGSWVLARYLANFGKVHHIHSRLPPSPDITDVEREHFTNTVENKKNENKNKNKNKNKNPTRKDYVIYIYRDPVAAMCSVERRFPFSDHLKNIECDDTSVTMADIVTSGTDLIGLNQFYRNYTTNCNKRKYPIYCIKYEQLFENINLLNRLFGIYNLPALYPQRVEHKTSSYPEGLLVAYAELRAEMAHRPFISIS